MSTQAQTLDSTATQGQTPGGTAVAPCTGWCRLFRDWAIVGGSTTLCQGLGVVTALGLRMILSPAQMGIWQALKLFLSYGNYANLGISKGAVREYTVARGRGDTQDAERGLNLAFTVNTVTSLVYMATLVAVGIWIAQAGATELSMSWALGLGTIGLLAVLSRYVTFHVTVLRASQEFGVTSRLAVLEALLTLGVCLVATWYWGIAGLCLGTLIVLTGALLYVVRHRAVSLSWAWDRREVGRLIVIGAPILLAGTISSLFRSLDKLMILGLMSDGAFQLGCYSVALMVSMQLYGLGNMLAAVMGPRYGEQFGVSGDRREVARLAARASELQAAAIVLPAALAVVLAPPLLGWLLPDYASGLASLVWLVPGTVATVMVLPAAQYLVAVNLQRRALAAVVAATLLAVLGNATAIRLGFGLSGVAIATSISYLAYYVLTVAVSIWPALDRPDRVRYVTTMAAAVVPTLGLALVLAGPASWTGCLASVLLILAVWGLTVAVGWTRGDWRAVLRRRCG